MKFVKFFIIFIVILGISGYAIYHFGTNIASEKIMDSASNELRNSGELEEIKKAIESDPQLKSFITEAKSIEHTNLPFTTKEEATKVLIQKIGISELNEIRVRVQEGTVSKEELLQTIQTKLTEEEIQALKLIAYKELYAE